MGILLRFIKIRSHSSDSQERSIFRKSLRMFGDIWGCLRMFGDVWGCLGIFGDSWAFFGFPRKRVSELIRNWKVSLKDSREFFQLCLFPVHVKDAFHFKMLTDSQRFSEILKDSQRFSKKRPKFKRLARAFAIAMLLAYWTYVNLLWRGW